MTGKLHWFFLFLKKGSCKSPANYRPISLTCIPCKILKHNIPQFTNTLRLTLFYVLLDNGFRKNRSCETQFITTIYDIATHLNSGNQVDVLFLDFTKVFDKVAHNHLLHKLNYYGICGLNLEWIEQFLADRTQQVVVENKFSTLTPVISGVSQLGPLLFLLFINDLPINIDSLVKLYTNDVLMYRSINDVSDHQILQDDLNKLVHWSTIWLMPFNPIKYEHLIITNKFSPFVYNYKRNDTKSKYLGLTISHSLSWFIHISGIIGRATSALALFRGILVMFK